MQLGQASPGIATRQRHVNRLFFGEGPGRCVAEKEFLQISFVPVVEKEAGRRAEAEGGELLCI